MLKHLSAATNLGHFAVLRVDANNAEALVGLQNRLKKHPITRFKNVQRQELLREQHDVRQGEQGKLPHRKIGHERRVVGR